MKREPYIHLHKLDIPRVLEVIDPEATKYDFDGFLVNVHSKRLQTFKSKGISCAKCGIMADHFSVDRFRSNCKHPTEHLNLYAIGASGQLVLMTHDHIIPRSKGGKDALSNTQTMCHPCNTEKGNS